MGLDAFPCTKCGACCMRAGFLLEIVKLGYAKYGGPCKYLTPNMECAIYETRPLVCRINDNKPKGVTRKAWYRSNEDACNKLHLLVFNTERPPK